MVFPTVQTETDIDAWKKNYSDEKKKSELLMKFFQKLKQKNATVLSKKKKL